MRWKGYAAEDDTWEPASSFVDECIVENYRRIPKGLDEQRLKAAEEREAKRKAAFIKEAARCQAEAEQLKRKAEAAEVHERSKPVPEFQRPKAAEVAAAQTAESPSDAGRVDEMLELMFERFDVDCSGYIDMDEFMIVSRVMHSAMGDRQDWELEEEHLAQWRLEASEEFDLADSNSDRLISLSEFKTFYRKELFAGKAEEELLAFLGNILAQLMGGDYTLSR